MGTYKKQQIITWLRKHGEHVYWVIVVMVFSGVVVFSILHNVSGSQGGTTLMNEDASQVAYDEHLPFPESSVVAGRGLLDLESQLLDELDGSLRRGDDPAHSGEVSFLSPVPVDSGQFVGFSGYKNALGAEQSLVYDFTESGYQLAQSENMDIFLYFYSTWCQICQRESDYGVYPLFEQIKNKKIVGFMVHFNDTDTNKAERDLAKGLGVLMSNSKILMRDGKVLYRDSENWGPREYQESFGEFFGL
ncbi:MAG: thiol-disulfide isomerase/thioredoxin [Planctomycetota bacterium]|jgi:thiol-disulfide isomerase/thioredoxin